MQNKIKKDEVPITIGAFVTAGEIDWVLNTSIEGFLNQYPEARKAVTESAPDLAPLEVILNDSDFDLPYHWACYLFGQLAFQLKKHGVFDSKIKFN